MCSYGYVKFHGNRGVYVFKFMVDVYDKLFWWYMFVCCWGVRIGVVVCEVWMKMWKYEFLVKNEFDEDFVLKWGYESMFISVLIVFWCILTNNKVWETNLGQRGSKSEFLGEIGNPKIWVALLQLVSWSLPWRVTQCNTHVFGRYG